MLLKKEGEAAAVLAAAAVACATAEGEEQVADLYAQAQVHVLEMERKQAGALGKVEEELRGFKEGHGVSNEEHHATLLFFSLSSLSFCFVAFLVTCTLSSAVLPLSLLLLHPQSLLALSLSRVASCRK